MAVIFKFEFGVSESASRSNRQSDFSGRFNCRLEFRPVLEMPYTKQFLIVMLRYLTIVPTYNIEQLVHCVIGFFGVRYCSALICGDIDLWTFTRSMILESMFRPDSVTSR